MTHTKINLGQIAQPKFDFPSGVAKNHRVGNFFGKKAITIGTPKRIAVI
jgi:hypothetical protein